MNRVIRRIFMAAISRTALWLAGRVDYWDTHYADACNDNEETCP